MIHLTQGLRHGIEIDACGYQAHLLMMVEVLLKFGQKRPPLFHRRVQFLGVGLARLLVFLNSLVCLFGKLAAILRKCEAGEEQLGMNLKR